MTSESKPIIKSKVVIHRELHLPSTADTILDDSIESIRASVELIRDEQKRCGVHILLIGEAFEIILKYLNSANSSDGELVHTSKSLISPYAFIEGENNIKSLLFTIQKALRAIKDKLNIPSSADQAFFDSLASLKSSIKRTVPVQRTHKTILKQIKETLVNKLQYYPAVEEADHECHSFVDSIQLILAEQNIQDVIFEDILELIRSIAI